MNNEDKRIIRTIAIVAFCSSIMGILYCIFSNNLSELDKYFTSSGVSLLFIIFTKKDDTNEQSNIIK